LLASLLIVFREVLEAGMVVGIVLAATAGIPRRSIWIAGGVGAGVAGASLVALFAGVIAGALSGIGQEVFTAAVLLIAVVMLGWHNVWMARHGREIAAQMKAVGKAVRGGERTLLALAIVVAVAVLREGSEVVLFLYGIVVASHESSAALFTGGLLGVGLGGVLAWLLYRGLVAIPLRHLFKVTNCLMVLLAAGMAGQAAALLASVDVLPSWGDQVWNTSFILSESGLLGQALHALVGYSDRPPGIQVAAYLATLIILAWAAWQVGRGDSGRSRPLTRSRHATPILVLLAAFLVIGPVYAQTEVHLTIKDHRYTPDRIEVPAGAKFKILVKNEDETTEEFESDQLKREKLVPPGEEIPVLIGPLEPGDYNFFGDFHRDTAQGVLVAK
jgi:high-affinity iron transporter